VVFQRTSGGWVEVARAGAGGALYSDILELTPGQVLLSGPTPLLFNLDAGTQPTANPIGNGVDYWASLVPLSPSEFFITGTQA
jgi:hypothetical protein